MQIQALIFNVTVTADFRRELSVHLNNLAKNGQDVKEGEHLMACVFQLEYVRW